ncbi:MULTISPECIES: coenzyme F420-0:L-glutamate ligase [Arthrobacter]|uniref:coenzyme F420-0:L-glutamate ligase n=1 Tax=Arthrobacter TaxID=1663 RepID=UPI001D15C3DF|nr:MULTISPECIES: coenzyme F420-0:L-glutamate ligase [Arthrobacter]MCC3282679.1 coenzyme F420-0:L-glutamate ligase [Arthrobacter caoxuetaonis]MCC9193641.1 coenzyme F420-0:L-glutamate ligase [Arthrobacter sp. zg-Y916]
MNTAPSFPSAPAKPEQASIPAGDSSPARRLVITPVRGIGEVRAGDDLVELIGRACGRELRSGDILAVTSKIVSKAEGRTVPADRREEAVEQETVRVVASRETGNGTTRIVENRLGIVAAAAGVDASNTAEGTVLLLPLDPDASARALCRGLKRDFGVDVGVIITDTLGRPWRQGQTDAAIGAAGISVLLDLRGQPDGSGRPMSATVSAVADEIAAAADLVKGKAAGLPVALVRGLDTLVTVGGMDKDPGARALLRPAAEDMFRQGSTEAYEDGRRSGTKTGYNAGYDDGHAAGYEDGYAAGYAAAASEARRRARISAD